MRHQKWRPISTRNWPLYFSIVLSLLIHTLALLHTPNKEMARAETNRIAIHLATRALTHTKASERIPIRTPSENIRSQPYHSLAKLPTTTEIQPDSPREFFFPTYIMDRPPFPVSAPTPQVYLKKTEMPATLVRLRLYIDEKGQVVDVTISAPDEISKTASRQIREMFLATSFIPGHINDTDLPCFMDIEVDLASYVE